MFLIADYPFEYLIAQDDIVFFKVWHPSCVLIQCIKSG